MSSVFFVIFSINSCFITRKKKIFPLLLAIVAILQSISNVSLGANLEEKETLLYPTSLYQTGDYYRSISEILRIQFQWNAYQKKDEFNFLLGKNYYQLDLFSKSIQISKTILNQTKDQQFQVKSAQLLSLSYLKRNQENLSYSIWKQYLPDSKKNFPRKNKMEGLIDPNRAKLYSTILPGSGFLLSREYKKAFGSFFLNALFIAGTYYQYQQGNPGIASLLFFFEIGWYKGGRNAAYESAELANQRKIQKIRNHWFHNQEKQLGL
ncbi:MAG: hypothetical protein ACI86H_002053 [bacterium]|jgi:hypothetical protein